MDQFGSPVGGLGCGAKLEQGFRTVLEAHVSSLRTEQPAAARPLPGAAGLGGDSTGGADGGGLPGGGRGWRLERPSLPRPAQQTILARAAAINIAIKARPSGSRRSRRPLAPRRPSGPTYGLVFFVLATITMPVPKSTGFMDGGLDPFDFVDGGG